MFPQALPRCRLPGRLYTDYGPLSLRHLAGLRQAPRGADPRSAASAQGKGKIEHLERTLFTELTGMDMASLEALKRRLWAFSSTGVITTARATGSTAERCWSNGASRWAEELTRRRPGASDE